MQFHLMNNILKNCIKEINLKKIKYMKINSLKLFSYQRSKFTEFNSCIFLNYATNIRRIKKLYSIDDIDREWLEDFENHFHVEEFLENVNNHKYYILPLGLVLFDILKSKLIDNYPNEQFTMSYSYDIKPYSETLRSGTIRFYKNRTENPKLIDFNLDNYKESGVGIYFVNRK